MCIFKSLSKTLLLNWCKEGRKDQKRIIVPALAITISLCGQCFIICNSQMRPLRTREKETNSWACKLSPQGASLAQTESLLPSNPAAIWNQWRCGALLACHREFACELSADLTWGERSLSVRFPDPRFPNLRVFMLLGVTQCFTTSSQINHVPISMLLECGLKKETKNLFVLSGNEVLVQLNGFCHSIRAMVT